MKLLLHKRLAGKVSYPTPAFLGTAAFKNQHARRFPSQSGFLQGSEQWKPDGHGQHLPQNCRGGVMIRQETLVELQDEPADIGVTPGGTKPPSQPQICIGAVSCSEEGKCRERSADVGRDLGKASRSRPPL